MQQWSCDDESTEKMERGLGGRGEREGARKRERERVEKGKGEWRRGEKQY